MSPVGWRNFKTNFKSSPSWPFSKVIFAELNLDNFKGSVSSSHSGQVLDFKQRVETLLQPVHCLVNQITCSEIESKGRFPREFQSYTINSWGDCSWSKFSLIPGSNVAFWINTSYFSDLFLNYKDGLHHLSSKKENVNVMYALYSIEELDFNIQWIEPFSFCLNINNINCKAKSILINNT